MGSKQQRQEALIYWWPEANKLVFLKEQATPAFWDRKWQTEDWRKKITSSRNSRFCSRILKRYLPDKNCRILEGGCGYGHIVDAMDHWGYRSIGVDFAAETVAKIKEVMPNLDVRCGDVRALNFEDNYFDGYWSLGVIEHFWEGYDDILREMWRVLRPGGYAFVSFPCISWLGRIKIFFSGYEKFTASGKLNDFYQFGLDISNVRKNFEAAGFECVRIWRKCGWLGLKQILPIFERPYSRMMELSTRSRIIKLIIWGMDDLLVAPLCGHGVLLVLRKR
jgi:SAM-dependent methyltransferase